jgi:hypothetical protein
MTSGQLPFNAPTVAGILMKQITEPGADPARDLDGVPEDLSLAIARCLEKDPENRWPTADALRRSWRAEPSPATGPPSRSPAPRRARAPPGPVPDPPPRRSGSPTGEPGLPDGAPEPETHRGGRGYGGGARGGSIAGGKWVRNERGEWVRADEANDLGLTDTGEPRVVQRVRGQFAKWAAATGGCFLLNLATGITNGPWFLFVAAGFGFRCSRATRSSGRRATAGGTC